MKRETREKRSVAAEEEKKKKKLGRFWASCQ